MEGMCVYSLPLNAAILYPCLQSVERTHQESIEEEAKAMEKLASKRSLLNKKVSGSLSLCFRPLY